MLQHRANGFTRGLDNWLYLANGDSGGTEKSMKTGKKLDLRLLQTKFFGEQLDHGGHELYGGRQRQRDVQVRERNLPRAWLSCDRRQRRDHVPRGD